MSKYKIAAFVAGSRRNICPFTAHGDELVLNKQVYDDLDSASTYLIQALVGAKKPGTVLGTYIKGVMQPARGGLKKFAEFAVSSLPDDASAAGIRPGAINTLCTNVPVQLCVSNTGHDFRGFSSFFEYVGATIPQLMPGAVLLAGYPPLTWGTTGKGPVPASFAALVAPGVDEEKLELMLIALFQVSCAVNAASTDHHPLLA